jgi:hypothetical protein
MRFGTFVELFVKDQRPASPEFDRHSIAERPFAAVAVGSSDIAVDVQPVLVLRPVLAGTYVRAGMPVSRSKSSRS